MARSSTSYTEESRKNVKPRGKAKKTLMLEAIRAECGDEHEFLRSVVRQAIGKEPEGDDEGVPPNPVLMNMVLQRIEPPIKSVMPLQSFPFDITLPPHQQASQALDAAAKGLIPPDVAGMYVSSIASMIKIEEVTEISRRLDELEKALGKSSE